ncbi:actin-like ATPase involved in cell division [Desulfosporosinus acidiphilus SJ4]|uniref:Actin-like ATPase involved in cell division n=1 Tax=Desulfosporosinus acidiphilus (strain DSM 22704 / JCM 16185 / SJ4) TaxID=646529 RepID=I4D868_DESAJ|nr:rod shape-determining protein [Desulfosporosinus acidiphilus]AFM41992.1 actin-like ATPase involved in cell division [Desulfosporosinus acidiphilus SJ4]
MEPIFALDIGTRMVMGLVMTKHKDHGYEILASASTEHRQRAMYDGQVHDVNEVARAVTAVKETLEKKLEVSLKHVAVAAAGRALRTEVAAAEYTELLPVRWERETILALELEAVHKALRQLKSSAEDDSEQYHCVGYSTIASWNEGEEISNLIGQRGKRAQVKVIATFLPRTVVDGLISVLSKVGLEMTSLTLEPIAAGQAAIPQNMRRLNLALVDVGAGTADIALTREGSFFAYGMVPMAGDEVTEAICEHFLLDFQVGEKIKREINIKSQLKFSDFLGTKVVVSKDDVLSVIEPVVRRLAQNIAQEIIKLNQKVPQGVILIGGGSLTPLLPQMLSELLDIAQKRVGVQVRERLTDIYGEKSLKGPESITPMGIGISALEETGLQYYTVTVNQMPIPIFEIQLTTVAEALLAAGISPRSFVGKPGAAFTYEWNHEMRMIKGTMGRPAQLSVNSQPGRFDQTLNQGDIIEFIPGIPGEDAEVTIGEILPPSEHKLISWNGRREDYFPQVFLDGTLLNFSDKIRDGYKLTYISNEDLQDLLDQKSLQNEQIPAQETLTIKINGEFQTIILKRQMLVNGCSIKDNCPIHEGDIVEVRLEQKTVGQLNLQPRPLIFTVNGEEIEYPAQNVEISFHGKPVAESDLLEDGMDLRVTGHKKMLILSDLLPYVKFPDEMPKGASLKLRVNGQMAEFTTVLHPGDRVTAIFE